MVRSLRVGFLLSLLLAHSTVVRADEVDDFVGAAMQKRQIPGLGLLVVRDAKVVKAQGYGLANVELNIPVTSATVFPLASVSKQFIAAGVLILAQDGQVDLDGKLSSCLKGTPEAWAEITVRQLLTHTSGIVRDDPLGMQARPTVREMFQAVAGLKLDAAPGERWAYSNVGYNLLSLVIEEVSGMPWDTFLERRIFAPLGMSTTRRFDVSAIVPNRAAGYVRGQGGLRNAPVLGRDLAAGGLLTTLDDLAKWAAALETELPLTKASRDAMWTPATLKDGSPSQARGGSYGFGWMVSTAQGHRLVAHGGARPGFTSYVVRYRDNNLTVALLMNCSGVDPAALASGVVGHYLPNRGAAKPDR
jgi:CubicO group peptidase (beta-lactamase class C family)